MTPGQIRTETIKQLRETKAKMLDLEFQLSLEKEPPEVRREAAVSLSNTEVAVLKLRAAELAEIRDQLAANEADLKRPAESLKKVKEVLAAASAFLGIVGRIVKLL